MNAQAVPDPADYLPRVTTSTRMLLAFMLTLALFIVGILLISGPPIVTNPAPTIERTLYLHPGDDIQSAFDRAVAGTTIVLRTGEFHGRYSLIDKHELTVVAEEGSAIVAVDGVPLTIDRGCRALRLEGLVLRYAGSPTGRSHAALVIRDSTAVTLNKCDLESARGAGLLAERVSMLSIEGGTSTASEHGIWLDGCDRFTIARFKATARPTSGDSPSASCAFEAKRSNGQLNHYNAEGWTDGIRASGEGRLQVDQSELLGRSLGTGLRCSVDSVIEWRKGLIARFEKAALIEPGGTLLAEALTLRANRFVGIQALEGARFLRLSNLRLEDQARPFDSGSNVTPDNWEIDPVLLPR